MSEIEHFSKALYFSGSGEWVTSIVYFAVVLFSFVASIVLVLWILSMKRALLKVCAAPFVLLVAVGPLLGMMFVDPFGQYGEINHILLEEVAGERLLTVAFTKRGKGTSTTTAVFTMAGEELGSSTRSGEGPQVLGRFGGAMWVRDGKDLLLIDRRTRDEIANVTDALDDAYGSGQYQVKGTSAEGVTVLRKNGQTDTFNPQSLLPSALRDVPGATYAVRIDNPDLCSTSSRQLNDDHKTALKNMTQEMGLLQPRMVHASANSSDAKACVFNMGREVTLVLHQSTAFGDDGAFLLSAVPSDELKKPLWTTDLTPATGPDPLKDLQLLHVQMHDASLCFWMMRARRALSEVCVNTDTGALRSAKVIF